MAQRATRPGRSSTTGLVQLLRLQVDLVEISSHGSAVLKAGLHPGKSTGRTDPPTRLLGNNVQLLLDLLEDLLLGSSDLVDTAAIASTVVAVAVTVVLHLGSNPEATTEARTTMAADTVVDTAGKVDTEAEAMARVHLPEALLHGCSRKHTLVTAPPAWTTTVPRRHLHRLLLAFRLHRLLAICRRPLPLLRSSGRWRQSNTNHSLYQNMACNRDARSED